MSFNFCLCIALGGKSGGNRRSAAGQLVLNAASPAPDCDINLLLVSHLKMQQVQAEQLARNDRIEKMVSQLLNCIKRRPGTTQSPEPATPSASITQQVGR